MSVSTVPRPKAERLAELLPTYSTGTSKQTGARFFIVPSSNRLAAHWTAVDGSGCTCRGYQYRGHCTHTDAAKLLAERQRPAPAPRKTYEDLFPACKGGCGDVSDTRDGYCDRCASQLEYEQRMAIKRETVARGTVKEAWL